METNFDYLLEKSEYASFAAQAVEAEKSIAISPATCAILSRRALELAVRFEEFLEAHCTNSRIGNMVVILLECL